MVEPTAAPDHRGVPPRPGRRLGRLSLRGLMLLVLVIGGLLGWQARRVSVQRRAVAELGSAHVGFTFAYDYDSEGTYHANGQPWAPLWLRRLAGDEWFREVATVDVAGHLILPPLSEGLVRAVGDLDRLDKIRVYNAPVSDAELLALVRSSRPRQLLLQETAVTPGVLSALAALGSVEDLTIRFPRPVPGSACFPALGEMARLRRLWVIRLAPLAPDELAPLRSLRRLEALLLKESPRDESCLEHVRGLPALEFLALQQTEVTDAGLRRLAPLTHLRQLLVDGSAVTDAGLEAIAAWPMLSNLALHDYSSWSRATARDPRRSSRKIQTDAGLVAVARATRLEQLFLSGQRFTDAGLAALDGLTKLNELSLEGVEATPEGFKHLLAHHQFTSLELAGPGVADAWLPWLANQTQLTTLSLQGRGITDAGVAAVVVPPSITYLDFSGSSLTDAGLASLATARRGLQILGVRGTQVTEEGIAAFRRAQPRCRVLWDQGSSP